MKSQMTGLGKYCKMWYPKCFHILNPGRILTSQTREKKWTTQWEKTHMGGTKIIFKRNISSADEKRLNINSEKVNPAPSLGYCCFFFLFKLEFIPQHWPFSLLLGMGTLRLKMVLAVQVIPESSLAQRGIKSGKLYFLVTQESYIQCFLEKMLKETATLVHFWSKNIMAKHSLCSFTYSDGIWEKPMDREELPMLVLKARPLVWKFPSAGPQSPESWWFLQVFCRFPGGKSLPWAKGGFLAAINYLSQQGSCHHFPAQMYT